jgi:hypothetical protein
MLTGWSVGRRHWWPIRVVGAALLLGGDAVPYGALVAVAVVSFVELYEEPTLAAHPGAEYEHYRRDVPGWWPEVPVLRRRGRDRRRPRTGPAHAVGPWSGSGDVADGRGRSTDASVAQIRVWMSVASSWIALTMVSVSRFVS